MQGQRGSALVVDARAQDAELLADLLVAEDLTAHQASEGYEALARFALLRPDFVFIEADLPGMTAFELASRIKAMAGLELVPIIFMTARHDAEILVRCTEAGGDDFLNKPINHSLLKARLIAMERLRTLRNTVASKQRTLSALLEHDQDEQELAERLLSRAVQHRNQGLEPCGLVQRAASIFNGDLVLSQRLPDGGVRVLLGDFTGHGLAAAVGALSVADAFHAMSRKGVDDLRLLTEINHKLYQLLPADRFMAAYLVSVPGKGTELRFWNGGMPSAWLRTRSELRELPSQTLPLGILPDLAPTESPWILPLRGGERLLLMSDGLLEAADAAGEMLVSTRFPALLQSWQADEALLPRLIAALDTHCPPSATAAQADDIAVLEMPLDAVVLGNTAAGTTRATSGGWSWTLELSGERLAYPPTLEGALRPLGLLAGLEPQLTNLEVIFAELYSQALEFGVLGLDGAVRMTPQGFAVYHRERRERLATCREGRIRISVVCTATDTGGVVTLRVREVADAQTASAPPGDMPTAAVDDATVAVDMRLLHSLCAEVIQDANGRVAEVSYQW